MLTFQTFVKMGFEAASAASEIKALRERMQEIFLLSAGLEQKMAWKSAGTVTSRGNGLFKGRPGDAAFRARLAQYAPSFRRQRACSVVVPIVTGITIN